MLPARAMAAAAPTAMPMMAPRPRPPEPPLLGDGAELPDAEAPDACGDAGEGVAAGGWAGAWVGGLPGLPAGGDCAAGLLEGDDPPPKDTPFTLRPAGQVNLSHP